VFYAREAYESEQQRDHPRLRDHAVRRTIKMEGLMAKTKRVTAYRTEWLYLAFAIVAVGFLAVL
jgi:predicted SAM-dependent methyltransferase